MMAIMDEILFHNEEDANRFITRCIWGLVVISALVNILVHMGIFDLDVSWTNYLSLVGVVGTVIPTLLVGVLHINKPYIKYIILADMMIINTVFIAYLCLYPLLLIMVPLILACHYYSLRYLIMVYAATIVYFTVGMYVGFVNTIGEFKYLKYQYTDPTGLEYFTKSYYIPAIMILTLALPVCITLVQRSKQMMVKQAKDFSEKQAIAGKLMLANMIQDSVLPKIFPKEPECVEFESYAAMHPAKEVGGDFYDLYFVDETHFAVIVADVSGKGVPAAMFMMIAKALLKDKVANGMEISEAFEKVNEQLYGNNEAEMFITAWMGILDVKTGEMEFVNAGHNPPFIKKKDGEFQMLKDRSGFVLAGMDNLKYKPLKLQMEPQDVLFLYTDGITEAINTSKEEYGEKRLKKLLDDNATVECKELLAKVNDSVAAFVGEEPQFDDMTMLALRFQKYKEEGSDGTI